MALRSASGGKFNSIPSVGPTGTSLHKRGPVPPAKHSGRPHQKDAAIDRRSAIKSPWPTTAFHRQRPTASWERFWPDAINVGSTESNAPTTTPTPSTAPRRHLTAYPAAAAQYASHRISGGWSGGGGNDGSGDGVNGNNPAQPINKKLELWKRRWVRAKEILDGKSVMLRSWKVGTDVMDDAVKLVERAKNESD
ncbi:hypothetical protein MMC16_001311 [Acarospora aff. strigata]|nr:hypothetical protein [Acarospora aff. strigata]